MPLDWTKLGQDSDTKSVKSGTLDWSQLNIDKQNSAASDQYYKDMTTSKEGQQLAKELRAKADRELLTTAGGSSASPGYTALESGVNAFAMNVPRNIAAGVRTLKTGESFQHEYDYLKAIDEASQRQNPKSHAAGLGTGIVAQGILMAPEAAASWGGRALQSGVIGGGTGYVSELMDSHDPSKAAWVGVTGAALGTAAAPVVELAGGAVGNLAGRGANIVRGAVAPAGEAERRVVSAVANDMTTGRAGEPLMTQAEAEAAHAAGQPVVVGDVGGATTHAMARDAKNTSPDAAQMLEDATMDRSKSQNSRIASLFDKLGWGKSVNEVADRLQQAGKSENNANYSRFRAATQGGIWNDDLARLISSPAGQDAIARTVKTSGNVSAARGGNPLGNPFVKDANGIFQLPPGVKPSGEFWDHLQRNLRGMADKAASYGEGDKFGAETINTIRKGINDIIDNETRMPNGESMFQTARQGAARYFGAEDALEAGKKFFSDKNMDIKDAQKFLSQFNKDERELFSQGYMAEASRASSALSDSADATKRMFNDPQSRSKLRLAVGGDKANQVEGFMRIEKIMTFLNNKVNGNSSTAQQLAQIGLAGGGLGAGLGSYEGYDKTDSAGAGIVAAFLTSMAGKHIDQRISANVGKLLASGDIEDIRKVYKLAQGNASVNKWLKDIEMRITGAASGKYADQNNNAVEAVKSRIIDIAR